MKETFEQLPPDVLGLEAGPNMLGGSVDFLATALPDDLAGGNVPRGVPRLVFIVMPQRDSEAVAPQRGPLDELAREYGPSAFFDALRSGVHHELTDEEVGAPTWEGFVNFLRSSGQSMSGFIAGSAATLQHLPETVRTESLSLAETIQNSFDQIVTRQVPQLQAAIRQQFEVAQDIDSVTGEAVSSINDHSFISLLRSQFARLPERSQEFARQIFRIERDIDVGNGKPREPVIASTVVYDHGKPAREKVNDALNSVADAGDVFANRLGIYLAEHPAERIAIDLSQKADAAVLDALIAAQNEASFILWSARHHPGRTLAFGSALVIQAVPVIGCVANANSGHQAEIAIPLPTPSSENTSRQPTPNIAQYSPNRGEVALNTESYEITSPEMVMAQAIGGLIQTSLKRADVASFTMVYFTDPGSSAQLNKGKLPPVYVRDKRDGQTYTVAFGGDSVSARLVRIGDGFDPKKNVYYDPEKGVNIPVFIRNSPDGPIRPEYFSPTLGGYIDASLWGDHDNPDDPKIGMAEVLVSYTGYLQAATEKIYQEDPKAIVTIQPMNFKDGGAVRFQLLIEKSDGTRAVFVERTIDHTFVPVQKMQGTEMYLGPDGYWYYVGIEGRDFKRFDPNIGIHGEMVNLSTPEANEASPTPVVPPPTSISEPQVLPTSVNNIIITSVGGGGEDQSSSDVLSVENHTKFLQRLEQYALDNNVQLEGAEVATEKGYEIIAQVHDPATGKVIRTLFVGKNGANPTDFVPLPDPLNNSDLKGSSPHIDIVDGSVIWFQIVGNSEFVQAKMVDGKIVVVPWAEVINGNGVDVSGRPIRGNTEIINHKSQGSLGTVSEVVRSPGDGSKWAQVTFTDGSTGWVLITDKGTQGLQLSSTAQEMSSNAKIATLPTTPTQVKSTKTPPPPTEVRPTATPIPETSKPITQVLWQSDFSNGEESFTQPFNDIIPGHYEYADGAFSAGITPDFSPGDDGRYRLYPAVEFETPITYPFTNEFDVTIDGLSPDKLGFEANMPWLSIASFFDEGKPTFHASHTLNVEGRNGKYHLVMYSWGADGEIDESPIAPGFTSIPLGKSFHVQINIGQNGEVDVFVDGKLATKGQTPSTVGQRIKFAHWGAYAGSPGDNGSVSAGTRIANLRLVNDNIRIGKP